MDLPQQLEGFILKWETLFLNLGEAVALALRALQTVDEPTEALAQALRDIATRLDALPKAVQAEITKGLYYLYLLIKHKRQDTEQEELFSVLDYVIERRMDRLREVMMTGAQVLINQGKRQGRNEGRAEFLLEQIS